MNGSSTMASIGKHKQVRTRIAQAGEAHRLAQAGEERMRAQKFLWANLLAVCLNSNSNITMAQVESCKETCFKFFLKMYLN